MINKAVIAALIALALSGCVTADTPRLTFHFPKADVQFAVIDGIGGGCSIGFPELRNTSGSDLGYVYTTLLMTDKDGLTIVSGDINFPPTVAGGTAQGIQTGWTNRPTLEHCGDMKIHLQAR